MAGNLGQALAGPVGPALAGGVQLVLSLLLLRKESRGEHLWFSLVGICSSVWALSIAIGYTNAPETGSLAARTTLTAITLAGVAGYRFSSTILRRPLDPWFRWISWAAIGVGAAILLVPSLTRVRYNPAEGRYWPVACPSLLLATVVAAPLLVIAAERLRHAWAGMPPSLRKRQLGWCTGAIYLGLLGAIDLRTVVQGGMPIAWITGTLAVVAGYYAVVQQRLAGPQTVLRRLGVTAASLAVLALGLLLLARLAPLFEDPAPLRLGLLVVVMFLAVRTWTAGLEPALERFLRWRRRRLETALAAFERAALDARSPDVIEARLAQTVAAGLEAEVVAFLRADRPRDGEPAELAAAESALEVRGQPVVRDLVDPGAPDAAVLLAALDHLGADALVPLFRAGDLLAMVALSGRCLRPADEAIVEDLRRLADSTARLWINARLYREVTDRSADLEAQVRLRTRELEQALDELRAAQARLVEAERSSSLGLLVAGISHEINNAINVIQANLPTLASYVAMCERARGPQALDADAGHARDELHGSIDQVTQAVRRTGAIIGDLRRFARPDSERRLVRVTEGIDAALNLLRRRTDGRVDVARVFIGDPSLDGYPGPLNLCFFHLLHNAVDAARSTIWVAARELPDGLEVIVEDDGPGMDDELQGQAFRPFFTTKSGATGLGLTVARGVAQRHGGALELESRAGEGTRVRLRLPSHAPEAKEATR